MTLVKLTAAIAAACAATAASAMAPMAEDGERDATWSGSPVSGQVSQPHEVSGPGRVTIIDRPVHEPPVISDTTPVEALGRGMGRANPDYDAAGVADREVITTAPAEEERWARGR